MWIIDRPYRTILAGIVLILFVVLFFRWYIQTTEGKVIAKDHYWVDGFYYCDQCGIQTDIKYEGACPANNYTHRHYWDYAHGYYRFYAKFEVMSPDSSWKIRTRYISESLYDSLQIGQCYKIKCE